MVDFKTFVLKTFMNHPHSMRDYELKEDYNIV